MTVTLATASDLHLALAQVAEGRLRATLEAAKPGHRLRIADLPLPVMELVCEALQGDPSWVARLMVTEEAPSGPWQATATKLIELRNNLDKPLLVFLPPGLRTPAEDSLDVATFTELTLPGLTAAVVDNVMASLSAATSAAVKDALDFLRLENAIQSADQVARYLLSVQANGNDLRQAGGALCIFGLVPDFGLFSAPEQARSKLHRNLLSVRELQDDRRPLQERITRLKLTAGDFPPKLYGFLRHRYTSPAREWCRTIATDATYQNLTFDHWPFRDGEHEQHLRLLLQPLDLPVQTQDQVSGTAQMPVLNLNGRRHLKVNFRCRPKPTQIPDWKHVRYRLLRYSEDGPVLAWESNNYAAPKKAPRGSRTIKVQDLRDHLEEGTYFVRVDAYADDGSLLNQSVPLDPDNENGRKENESENFLVVDGDAPDVEPEKPRAVFVHSFEHAYGAAEAKALADSKTEHDQLPPRDSVTGGWAEAISANVHGDTHFSLSTPGLNAYTIRIPGLLRRTEIECLRHPEKMGWYQLDFKGARNPGDVVPVVRDGLPIGVGGAFDSFQRVRADLFADILSQHASRVESGGDDVGVVEVADLLSLEGQIVDYASKFLSLVEDSLSGGQAASSNGLVGLLAQLDLVEVRWRRTQASTDPGRALLLGPTHPLRMLWHLRHAQVVSSVLTDWASNSKSAEPSMRALFDEVQLELRPQNLPMVVFDRRGRAYAEQELLTPYWSLYLPTDHDNQQVDLAASRATARSLLGIKRGSVDGSSISSGELAQRLVEYVQLHPYVEQLRVNLFHPGDGQLLADTLREVERLRQRLPATTSTPITLRYAVNMFTTPGQVSDAGLAIEELLDPERQVGEDDEFTLASGDHLHPKLVFSRNHVAEFLRAPELFRAHLSVLVEQFRVEGRLRNLAAVGRGSYVGGLVHEATTLSAPEDSVGWVRGVHAFGHVGHPVGDLVVKLLDTYHRLQSTQAMGGSESEAATPVLALSLSPQDQALIRQVHDASDWVLTIDRNLGLDYFDRPSAGDDAGYLLDFTPEYVQEERQRLLLTTRSSAELRRLVRGLLEPALTVPEGGETTVLEALRSLSGRLALRLLAGADRHGEVLGLLMARWMLERASLLQNHILVPVDAHVGWFQSDDPDADRRRADLLLVGIEPETRTIELFVVEVKLRRDLAPSERAPLYRAMAAQAANTRDRFRARFDPQHFPNPRADLPLRAKELASLLGFYLGRSHRYALVDDEAHALFRGFIDTLDQGYRLRFQLSGVVFVQEDSGFRTDDIEPELPVYRFGSDHAQTLLDEAVEPTTGGSSDEGGGDGGGPPRPPPPSPQTPPAPSQEPSMRSLRSVLGARAPVQRDPEVPSLDDLTDEVEVAPSPELPAPGSAAHEDGAHSADREEPSGLEAFEPEAGNDGVTGAPGAATTEDTATGCASVAPLEADGAHSTAGVRFPVGSTSKELLTREVFFHPSNTALSHLNIGIVGDMGTGKTQLTKYIVTRFALAAADNRGHPPRFLIFDYKKDYSRPDFAQAVGARLVAPEGIPLNILRLPPRSDGQPATRADWVRRGNFLYDTLRKIYGGIGPVQKKRLRTAVVDAYQGASEEGHDAPLLSEVLERYADNGRPDSVESILSDLVDLEVFAEDREQLMDFGEFFQGVVVVKLNELGADQQLKNALVVFFLNLFYDWMLRVEKRPFIGQNPQLRSIEAMLLIDEADNIMQYDFAVLQQVLQQGREFGVGVLLASQYLSHFFRRSQFDYREPLLTWFVHRIPNVSPKDVEGLGLTEVSADAVRSIKELENHEFLCKTFDVNGRFAHGRTFWRLRQDAWTEQNPEAHAALQEQAQGSSVPLGRLLAEAMEEAPPDLSAAIAREAESGQ